MFKLGISFAVAILFSCCLYPLVPEPAVAITREPASGALYAGTQVTFTCTSELMQYLSANVLLKIEFTWSRDGEDISHNTTTVKSNLSDRPSYTSTLKISPLSVEDSADYVCQAKLTPVSPVQYIRTSTVELNENVTVEGMYVFA